MSNCGIVALRRHPLQEEELEVVTKREVEARSIAKKCKTRYVRLKAVSDLGDKWPADR